ncbi:MAG: NADH-quinone oxidoreductase subunit NuoK [Nitrospirae bacterium CG_4_10_14_3_um_filter_53_41]|nr:MAG: NADH-quinone oxidoreductase subunit NuoK [Nitrospirae bacterium CG17_big_fil_post_rev_8_21_14_2_50_50_9]PIX85871.1 MAG: NADH-quinone oxidoreductase subunit NuoK [Nitrospirae bacterium CG_4_10_14_3_um_filter_53_41]
MNIISLQSYLIISALLFSFGLFAIITRKNAISVLLGFELIMNAAGLNFAAFSHFSDSVIHGQVFTIFIIALAAAESAVILALIISVYQKMDTVQIDEIDSLKG